MLRVLNRGVGRVRLFLKDADFEAFERTIKETVESRLMRFRAYCLIPNHWHLLFWPREAGDLPEMMRRLTVTHTRRNSDWNPRLGHRDAHERSRRKPNVSTTPAPFPVDPFPVRRRSAVVRMPSTAASCRPLPPSL